MAACLNVSVSRESSESEYPTGGQLGAKLQAQKAQKLGQGQRAGQETGKVLLALQAQR